jgi:hypothetical protein
MKEWHCSADTNGKQMFYFKSKVEKERYHSYSNVPKK